MKIFSTVGKNGVNSKGDVALVQLALRTLKNGTKPFLSGVIDGKSGPMTEAAIEAFRKAHGVTDATTPGAHAITPSGKTMAKLNTLATIELGEVRVLPGTPVPYKPAPAADLTMARLTLSTSKLETNFRHNIISLINAMHNKYGLLLSAPRNGFHRSFAGQAAIRFSQTSAGPGESDHQFGHAIDLGFYKFKFYDKTGVLKRASFWLTYGARGAQSVPYSRAFWDARNALAKPLNVLPIGGSDIIHLRSAQSKSANPLRSLVALLDKQSTWKWEGIAVQKSFRKDEFNVYKCDLGGTTKIEVGTLRQIWSGNAVVDKAKIEASGWKRPNSLVSVSVTNPALAGGPGSATATATLVNPAPPRSNGAASLPVTDADVVHVKAELKKIMASADKNWRDWRPIP